MSAHTPYEAGKAAGENDRAMDCLPEDEARCPKEWSNTTAEVLWIRGYEEGRWLKRAA